ncbi:MULTISPECIES: NAD(P)H-binding protein [unclassified Streptomyces]|uniref:NAD(P)H-binding protein n=1 Tax=unclassified Streptomyces TaxID=2593676 RepID=UPI000364F582|nr:MULTISPECIES: NAD(P)H-binding protein [unclassified Streptomyces]MYT32286.1 NAD(P)H-binding protein [Streptomyces sp. SID8354]
MRVVVLGITTALGARLAQALPAYGCTPVGLIRKAAQREPLRAAGVETVLLDTDGDGVRDGLSQALAGAGAVVLAAGTGTGPGSLGAATTAASPAELLSRAAERAGVRRYVMVSALLPDETVRAELGDRLPAYLREKQQAEHALHARDLDWCVLRPGTLDDAPATGRIRMGTGADPRPDGRIARTDLAATLCEILTGPVPVCGTLAVSTGDVPVRDAVAALRPG